jgi:pyrroloquinoline quinone biosynthesis protein D
VSLTGGSRPALWRFARIDFDPVRQRTVLLYPEGAVLLNETAAEILALCDGVRTVDEIAGTLGARYQTDVRGDVVECLSRLADRELVSDADA